MMENSGNNGLIQFSCEIGDEIRDQLQLILPHVKTVILQYQQENQDRDWFCCELRCEIDNKDSALLWLKMFQQLTFTTYRSDKCYEENTPKTVFKKRYHCLHNTRPKAMTKNPHPKHTKCGATLMINIKQRNMKMSKDKYLKEFPCHIYIKSHHNHTIISADALRHRQPTQEVEDSIKTLFSKGHSPSSAWELFKIDLQEHHGDDYIRIAADGSLCPTRKWCYDLYYKLFKKEYGSPTGPDMIKSLQKMIDVYNNQCNEKCAILDQSENLAVAICSPLMRRIHKYLKTSQEIVFLDSSGNMDRHNSRIFLLLCSSPVGGLPLGIIMTYSETEVAITKGLMLLQALIGENAFYGKQTPQIIITDDCTAERNSLAICFPKCRLLLCKFHILQNVMRFLWDSKHGVDKGDRVNIYNMFKKIINSDNEDNFNKTFEECVNGNIIQKYGKVVNYFSSLKIRAREWATCYRQELLTRGNDTNNYCESAFRVLKDKILHRTKAFSIVQMFDYLSNNFIKYYERRITDVINNRQEGKSKSKHFQQDRNIMDIYVVQISDALYEVHSNNNEYIVDMKLETCSCHIGNCGAPCKHQYAVMKKFHVSTLQFLPQTDAATKQLLFKILFGTEPETSEWFDNLNVNRTVCNTQCVNLPINIEQKDDENSHVLPTKQYDTTKICDDLESFFTVIKEKVNAHPEVYCEAVSKFVSTAKSLTTDSALTSALFTFGKYSGGGAPLIKKGKNLQGGSTISVQPTAVARRKTCTGSRKAAHSGRPAKSSRTEHSYCKRKRTNVTEVPQNKQTKAPHSLNYLVENV